MMPIVEIYMSQSDIEAAKRIALKMYPHTPRNDDAQAVINAAAIIGLDRMRVVWRDAEDQQNAYANAMVKRDKLERDAGRPDGDRTSDGMPLKTGQ